MNKPYVFNRNYVYPWDFATGKPDPTRRTAAGSFYRRAHDGLPWAVETDTISDYFETHAEAIQFALSTTREPTA